MLPGANFLALIGFVLICFFIYVFYTYFERKKETPRGKLKAGFPNFVAFCEGFSATRQSVFELIEDDGRRLEFRSALMESGVLMGYIHLGIEQGSIERESGAHLFNYFVTREGKKINGYKDEVPLTEPSVENYEARYITLMLNLMRTRKWKRFLRRNGYPD